VSFVLLSWSVLQAAAAVSPFVSWSSKSGHKRLYWHTGIRESSDGDHQRAHQNPSLSSPPISCLYAEPSVSSRTSTSPAPDLIEPLFL
ncbi:Serine/threonine protein kinase, partial [Giardia duodenalis]